MLPAAGICRNWPPQTHATLRQCGDDRCNNRRVLVSQVPAFAGVRVQSAHDNFRLVDAELHLQIPMQHLDDGSQTFRGDVVGHGAQRQVRAGQSNTQFAGDQQHDGQGRVRYLCQELGVTGERDAGISDDMLRQRRGDHA